MDKLKLSEAIRRVDRSPANESYADVEEFSEATGVQLFHSGEFDKRVKAYWLWRWNCTDTVVGYRVYYMDGEPIAVSWQDARKSREEIEWVSKEAFYKVSSYMLELYAIQQKGELKLVDLDEELLALGYNVTYGEQLMDKKGVLADGTPVEVVRQYGLRYEAPVENWQTVDVSLPDGTVREKVPLSEIFFPFCLAKEDTS